MNGHNECESFIIAFENDSCFVYIILLWSGSTKNVLFIARIYVGTRDTLLARSTQRDRCYRNISESDKGYMTCQKMTDMSRTATSCNIVLL